MAERGVKSGLDIAARMGYQSIFHGGVMGASSTDVGMLCVLSEDEC